jgi:hypothetical protein
MIEKWCQSGSLPSEMRRYQPPSVPFVIPFLAPLRRRSGSAAGTDSADGATVIAWVHFLPLVHTSCNGSTH